MLKQTKLLLYGRHAMQKKIKRYLDKWSKQGYPDGIPDEAPAKLEHLGKVPSYRMICRAILKNDLTLSSLGFAKPKSELYSMYKKIELAERAKKKGSK